MSDLGYLRFRAWDKVAEDMFIPEALKLDKSGEAMGVFSKGTMFSVEGFELLQSTGLLDKNGIEIYDGDILSISKNHNKTDSDSFNNDKINCQVEFLTYDDMEGYANIEHYGWSVTGSIDGWYTDCTLIDAVKLWDAEILGNIYEHPNLLEED